MGLGVLAVITLIEVFLHRSMYFDGGVRYVDLVGSIAGRVLVVAAVFGVAWCAGQDFPMKALIGAGVAAFALAVGQGLLPPLAAGHGPVTVTLTVLFSLMVSLGYTGVILWFTGFLE